MPIKHQPKSTSSIPAKKQSETLHRKVKNFLNRMGPMTRATPLTNKMLPIVNINLSKNIITPKTENIIPKAVRPTPIFVESFQL